MHNCEGESAAELFFLAPEAMQVVGQGLLQQGEGVSSNSSLVTACNPLVCWVYCLTLNLV